MNIWKRVLPAAVMLIIAGQVVAQTDDQEIRIVEEKKVWVEEAHERNAEVDRQLYEAERRMAEAARQIAELSNDRLPQRDGMRQRIEIVRSDRPRLGVTIGGDVEGAVKGVSIVGVTPGSAADDAGLRSGDLITSINGESLGAPSADKATTLLLEFMEGVQNGDTLDLGYIRDGKTGEVEVEPKPIASRVFAFSGNGREFVVPDSPEIAVLPGVPRAEGPHEIFFHWTSDGWGDMELVELNEGLGQYFGTDQGLLVVSAPEAEALQLEDGDVIQKIDGREPTSVRHALRILGSYQAGESLELEIMRDKKRKTLDVEIPDGLSSGLLPQVIAPEAVVQPARAPAPSRLAVPAAPTERT
ncbi:MAG: PDZ domain-containing protein [Woeseiaceae bacterium]